MYMYTIMITLDKYNELYNTEVRTIRIACFQHVSLYPG